MRNLILFEPPSLVTNEAFGFPQGMQVLVDVAFDGGIKTTTAFMAPEPMTVLMT